MSESRFPFKGQGYDFIFLGAGCASLSIVMRMIKSGKFSNKKILLIDKEAKTKNDRTWCFWEKKDGFFDEIVYKKWDKLSFYADDHSSEMNIVPYQYKMIRGIDLYNYCFSEIAKHPNIEIIYSDVNLVDDENKKAILLNDKVLPVGDAIVFNSLYSDKAGSNKEISLLQHFKGWIIETPGPVFNASIATFMDFRVDQKRGTTFAYVLPFTETKALVEYTLFTENMLDNNEYEAELKSYIDNFLQIKTYNIIEKEFGIIPMTTKKFKFYKDEIYNIGTAGGQTKPSSGYTFQFIQKQSALIVDHLIHSKDLGIIPSTPNRFLFYDKVLLDVLFNNRASGKDIFSTIFKKSKPQQVLKFLDNESSLVEELKIISTLPILPFLKGAINQF